MRLLRERLYAGGSGVERVLCALVISHTRPQVLHDLGGQAQDMISEAAKDCLIAVFRS